MMKKGYPIKTCDYCKAVGMAYTTMSDETICHQCLTSVSSYPKAMRTEIFKLRTRNAELESVVARLREALCGLYEHTKNDYQIAALNTAAKEALEASDDTKRL